MSTELLCSWFGLPSDGWPPDHYRLLGLRPGEEDLALIEQRVHLKLDEVRRYQCLHPGPATEAMNRLAQAFGCLTDLAQKRVYDETVLGIQPRPTPTPSIPPVPTVALAVAGSSARPAPRDPHVWLYTPGMPGPGEAIPPPPVRRTVAAETLPMPSSALLDEPPAETVKDWEPPKPAVLPEAPPRDLVAESARSSEEATKGLSTRRAVYHRILQTRHLMRIWHQLARFLKAPEEKLSRQHALEMFRLIRKAEVGMHEFPLLGEAGQPGYLIITLTQLSNSAALLTLSPNQRESLARDWKAVWTFLASHRAFLRREAKKLRKRGLAARFERAFRAVLNEQPLAFVAVLAGIAALSIAVIRSLP
jgi:hypothetical protein